MLTATVVAPQHTPQPCIQWLLVSLQDVSITAYEQQNDAKILNIRPFLQLSTSNFLYASSEWTRGL